MAMSDVEPWVGQRLGRYELLLPVASGGMAEVWAARLAGTHGFRKIVAIKTILRTSLSDPRFERMFVEEANLTARLHHPNVVETIEFSEEHGRLYLVMEWVEGETLATIIGHANQRGGLPMSIAINIVGQGCKGLHAAHELTDELDSPLGLVHRDVSPQNLIVSYTGTAKLLDFGIAKATLRKSNLTEAGQLKGKFAYMSPEQLNGDPLDRRSDVFSVGVLLYMLTTGRHPFKGENTDETLKNIASDRSVTAPRQWIPTFPEGLASVLSKALAKKPAERFGSALELLQALERAHPECFDTSFEEKLSTFMRSLFEARIADRRAQLRRAELICERNGGVAPVTSAFEEAPSISVIEVRGTHASKEAALASDDFNPARVLSRFRPYAPWTLGAFSVSALAVLLLAYTGTSDGATPDSVSVSVSPAVTATSALHASETPGTPTAATVVKVVPDVQAARSDATPSSMRRRAPSKGVASPPSSSERAVERTGGAVRRAPSARAKAKARAVAAQPGAASTTNTLHPREGARSAPVNAWDPSTFGGRF